MTRTMRLTRVHLGFPELALAGVMGSPLAVASKAIGSWWTLPRGAEIAGRQLGRQVRLLAGHHDHDFTIAEDEEPDDPDDDEDEGYEDASAGARGMMGLPAQLPAGVAAVRIYGPLLARARADWCAMVDGYDAIERRIANAIEDPNTNALLLVVDSPGGQAAGMSETVKRLRAVLEDRGIEAVCYVSEQASSAAYALACVAGTIVAPAEAIVGSIGTIYVHTDESGRLQQAGIVPTIIASGARKADGTSLRPLSDEARTSIQSTVDTFAQAFAGVVAESRGKPPRAWLALEGQSFSGAEGVDLGLVDQVGSLEDALNIAAQAAQDRKVRMAKETAALPVTPVAASQDAEIVRAVRSLVGNDGAGLGEVVAVLSKWRDGAESATRLTAENARLTRSAETQARAAFGERLAALYGPAAVFAKGPDGKHVAANGLGPVYAPMALDTLEGVVAHAEAHATRTAPPEPAPITPSTEAEAVSARAPVGVRRDPKRSFITSEDGKVVRLRGREVKGDIAARAMREFQEALSAGKKS